MIFNLTALNQILHRYPKTVIYGWISEKSYLLSVIVNMSNNDTFSVVWQYGNSVRKFKRNMANIVYKKRRQRYIIMVFVTISMFLKKDRNENYWSWMDQIIIFSLKYSWFTKLHYLHVHNKVIHIIYVFFELFSIIGYYKIEYSPLCYSRTSQVM